MQHTKRLTSIVLAMLLAVSLFLLPSCRKPEPPEVETRDLTWPVSALLPAAEEYFFSLPEGCAVRFGKEYQFNSFGTYPIDVILTDAKGNEFSYTVNLTLVHDTTPPTIHGARDLVAYVGSGISYLTGVSATDDCHAKVTLTVDPSQVNLKKEGVYDVIYCATDAAGNVTKLRRTVSVYEEEITAEMLYSRLDPILSEIIRPTMTTKQKLRAIYDYVYDNVAYVSTSDKSSWVRAAYNGLVTEKGDCYTYFALSKAMMERVGIENRDVERLPELAAQVNERHYWSIVNIGSDAAPQWYHFDACHIKNAPASWGFLMTDLQLMEFSSKRVNADGIANYFYAYDKTAYPPTASEIITHVYP